MVDGNRYGVEVISPLRLSNGGLVLVNRGWLVGDPYRQSLPTVEGMPGPQRLRGYVYVPPGESFTLGDIAGDAAWPRLVQAVDPAAMFTMPDKSSARRPICSIFHTTTTVTMNFTTPIRRVDHPESVRRISGA